jgi:lysophospholipase L1-like esterase
MKKFIKALSVVIVAAMILSAIPIVANAKSNALAGKTIVTFGDSLTKLGNSASTIHYPDYLASDEYLGVPVINMGVGGESSATICGPATAEGHEFTLAEDVTIPAGTVGVEV